MDSAQVSELFKKWRKPIRSWLRTRSIPPGDVDDVAQEVFLRLLRYSNETVVDNPKGYLFRIASNVASEWREKSSVSKPHGAEWLEEIVDTREQPEDVCCRERLNKRIYELVNRLPHRQGIILLMHAHDGLTYNQIAKDLGLTYRIVLRDLTRAYTTLRFKLEDDV